jgi:hypothetical protein
MARINKRDDADIFKGVPRDDARKAYGGTDADRSVEQLTNPDPPTPAEFKGWENPRGREGYVRRGQEFTGETKTETKTVDLLDLAEHSTDGQAFRGFDDEPEWKR